MINICLSRILGDRLLKITDISNATGISRTTLTQLYYKRSQGITLDVLDKLCNHLDCDVGEILEYKKDS